MMAQDPRQPDGLVHRSCPTSEQFGEPHATATYPPRAVFAAGQPQGCEVMLTVPGPPGGGRCGTALGIPDRPWQVMGLAHIVVNSNVISSSM